MSTAAPPGSSSVSKDLSIPVAAIGVIEPVRYGTAADNDIRVKTVESAFRSKLSIISPKRLPLPQVAAKPPNGGVDWVAAGQRDRRSSEHV
jgi:hypothetical protein